MIRKPKTEQVLSLISVMKEGKYNKQQYFLTQKGRNFIGTLRDYKKTDK